MRRTFPLFQSAAPLMLFAASGCLAIDWGSYRVASAGEPCGEDGGGGVCEIIPEGWTAIQMASVADPATPPGTCPDGSTQTLYFTDPAGAPTCSPCGCALAPMTTCSAPTITCSYLNNTCSGGGGFTRQSVNAGCVNLNGISAAPTNALGSCKLSGPAKVTAGACDVTPATTMMGAPFGGAALVCNVNAVPAGCEPGARCVAGGSEGAACILRAGTDPCPAGWGTSIAAFTGGDDHRGCSACSCVVACTGGGYVVHDANACVENSPPVSVMSNACKAVPNIFDTSDASLTVTLAKPQVSMCTGGVAEGQVDGTGPVQICCK